MISNTYCTKAKGKIKKVFAALKEKFSSDSVCCRRSQYYRSTLHSSLFWPFPFRPYFFRQISNQIFKIFHTCITFDIQTPILYIFFMKIYWVVFFKETFFHFHLQKNLSLMKWNSLFNPRIREHYLWNDSEWSIATFPTFKSLRKDLNKDKNQN